MLFEELKLTKPTEQLVYSPSSFHDHLCVWSEVRKSAICSLALLFNKYWLRSVGDYEWPTVRSCTAAATVLGVGGTLTMDTDTCHWARKITLMMWQSGWVAGEEPPRRPLGAESGRMRQSTLLTLRGAAFRKPRRGAPQGGALSFPLLPFFPLYYFKMCHSPSPRDHPVSLGSIVHMLVLVAPLWVGTDVGRWLLVREPSTEMNPGSQQWGDFGGFHCRTPSTCALETNHKAVVSCPSWKTHIQIFTVKSEMFGCKRNLRNDILMRQGFGPSLFFNLKMTWLSWERMWLYKLVLALKIGFLFNQEIPLPVV
jgi:hypothetical protein